MSENPTSLFVQQIQNTWSESTWGNTRILLAVSGGADSVALLRALHQIAGDCRRLDVAHFNHGWRGLESDGDEAFVRELCTLLGARIHVGRVENGLDVANSEEAAREQRYAFLESTAYRVGARYVVTAHTASDRVETMLHHLFRGTGLAGARSIRFQRPLGKELILVRPMLHLGRDAVLDFLKGIGQAYREDSSNRDETYRRNFIRRTVLPSLREQYGPCLDENLLAFADLAAETEQLLKHYAAEYWQNVEIFFRQAGPGQREALRMSGDLCFPNQELLCIPWPVLRQALADRWIELGWPIGKMTRVHWRQIHKAYRSQETGNLSPGAVDSVPDRQVQCNLPGDLQLATMGDWVMVFASRNS